MQFFLRVLRILVQPSSEWLVIKNEASSPASLFKGYAVPLALVLFASVLPVIFTPGFYLSAFFGLVINALIFSATVLLMHVVSVVIETFSAQMKAPCTRETAMKLSYYSATPIVILLTLFPLIQGLSLIGFPWALLLFISGSKKLLNIPPGSFMRFIIATTLLTIAALFMLNLFIVGMINIVVGPQPG